MQDLGSRDMPTTVINCNHRGQLMSKNVEMNEAIVNRREVKCVFIHIG